MVFFRTEFVASKHHRFVWARIAAMRLLCSRGRPYGCQQGKQIRAPGQRSCQRACRPCLRPGSSERTRQFGQEIGGPGRGRRPKLCRREAGRGKHTATSGMCSGVTRVTPKQNRRYVRDAAGYGDVFRHHARRQQIGVTRVTV